MTRWTKLAGTLLLICLLMALATGAFAARHRIVLECEKYNEIKASTKVVSGDTNASGGKYVEYPLRRPHATSENSAVKGDGGFVTFKVKIPEQGNYTIWVRTNWYDGCANSFFLVVDTKAPVTIGGDGTYKVWKWRKASQPFALTAGTHAIKIQNREDGAKADQFLVTNDSRFMPTRVMTATTEFQVPPPE